MGPHTQKRQHCGSKHEFELHTTVPDWGALALPIRALPAPLFADHRRSPPIPPRWKWRRPAPTCAKPPRVTAGHIHHPAQRLPSQTNNRSPTQSLPAPLITLPIPTLTLTLTLILSPSLSLTLRLTLNLTVTLTLTRIPTPTGLRGKTDFPRPRHERNRQPPIRRECRPR